MKEVNGIQILEDIELEGVVGGTTKKKVATKKSTTKKAVVKKQAGPGLGAGGPELI